MKLWIKGSWSNACYLHRCINKADSWSIAQYVTQHALCVLNSEVNYFISAEEIHPDWKFSRWWFLGDAYDVESLQNLTDRDAIWKAES